MTEKREENNVGGMQLAQRSAQQAESAQSSPPAKKDKKLLANAAFNGFNFLGLHWVGNSALSLWITYNILPKKPAQALMGGLTKYFKPVAEVWAKGKGFFGFNDGLASLSPEMRAENVAHSARSFVETLCMCVAGCVILVPVKYLEDHKTPLVNWMDNLFHPGKKHRQPENAQVAQEPEHHETWTNLIRTRFISLIPIFAIDNQLQKFNNSRFNKGVGNLDTWEWEAGSHAFQNMKPGVRDWFVNLFARKKISLAGVQPLVRERLLDTLESPEELHRLSRYMGKLQERKKHAEFHKDEATVKKINERIANLNELLIDPDRRDKKIARDREEIERLTEKMESLTAENPEYVNAANRREMLEDRIAVLEHQKANPKDTRRELHRDRLNMIEKEIERTETALGGKISSVAHETDLKAKRARLEIKRTRLNKYLEGPMDYNLKNEVERAIFSEQTRLFSKEVSLTLVYTGFLFLIGKTKTAARVLEALHLKRKEKPHTEHAEHPAPAHAETPAEQHTAQAAEPSEKRWSEREENQPKERKNAPASSFQESALQNQQGATVSI